MHGQHSVDLRLVVLAQCAAAGGLQPGARDGAGGWTAGAWQLPLGHGQAGLSGAGTSQGIAGRECDVEIYRTSKFAASDVIVLFMGSFLRSLNLKHMPTKRKTHRKSKSTG